MKITKPLKAIMERSGRLKKARGAAISKEISKTDTFDEQMAVAMNAIEAIFTFVSCGQQPRICSIRKKQA